MGRATAEDTTNARTVRFVDVRNMARWIADSGLERTLVGMVDALEHEFRRWPDFDKIARTGSQSSEGVAEVMPTCDGDTFGFKYVHCHPTNAGNDLQTVSGFGVLSSMHTGYPYLFTEMTLLTALRTAATSAMVAKVLAPPAAFGADATMGIIGCGAQSEFQVLAMRANLGINRVRAWDTDPCALDKFALNAERLGFDVHRASGAGDAIEGVQIITTCTADMSNATIIDDDMLRAAMHGGVHINAIGGDCPGKTEFDPEIVKRASIFVEHAEQTFIEGEIQCLPSDWPVTEFWQVLTGQRPGRTSASELTMFDSVGFAIEDFAAMTYLDAALNAPGGDRFYTTVDLVAQPSNPKNLFRLIDAESRSLVG